MCRFLAYSGATTSMQELLFDSSYSLVRQSKHARMRFEPVNGDGFGVGWYAQQDDPVPGIFLSIEPAWSNRNLQEIAAKIQTSHFFAHVRDASTGMPVSQANCHPFKFGHYLWMHNGFLSEFSQCRRKLLTTLSDTSFQMIKGNTDSEHTFAVFIDELGLDEAGLTEQLPVNTSRILSALTRTIKRIINIRKDAGCHSEAHMNFAVSNGHSSLFTRFCDTPGTAPPTLHYLQNSEAIIVASEPLSEDVDWQELSNGEVLILEDGQDMKILNLDL